MDRTGAKGRASVFRWPVVWLGCALVASLECGCAGNAQLANPSGRSSPPACACDSPTAPRSDPGTGGSSQPARRPPRTVCQALRAYLDCLHSPLSERGPGMNVAGGSGDTGTSREQAGDDNHRSEGLQRVLLLERRRSALLPLKTRTRLVPPWVGPRPRGWRVRGQPAR